MSTPARRVVAALAAVVMGLIPACGTGPRLSLTAAQTLKPEALWPAVSEAHRKGLAWLIAAQNKDGSWGSFESARPSEDWFQEWASCDSFQNATCALCVMALQGPSRTDPAAEKALDKGVDYLLRAAPTARVSGEYLYDNWSHLYLVHALSLILQDPRFAGRRGELELVIRREIEALTRRQSADGGWGYYDFGYGLGRPSGNDSTCFMTAGIVLALDEAKRAGIEVPPTLTEHGLRVVERLRLGNGAYIYGNYARLWPGNGFNRVKGSLGRSQPCNLALFKHQRVVTKEDLRRGIENLFANHHFIEIGRGRPIPHEAWYSTAAYYYLFGHFYAAKVLDELDPADRKKWHPVLAEILVRDQDPAGSWIDYPMYQFDRPYGTAFALMILQACRADEPGGKSAD